MKTFTTSAVLATALVGLFAGPARAQERAEANIPFPFVVSGQEFPAGHYEFSMQDGVLDIRGIDHPLSVFAMTNPAAGQDPAGNQTALVFTRSGNEYELSQVWESRREGLEIASHATAKKQTHAAATITPTVVLSSSLEANWK
jgi:hypothetical protein